MDSREQDALNFSEFIEVKEIVQDGLRFGDYGALYQLQNGVECKSPVFFERKSIPDLFGTLTDESRIERLKNRCKEAIEVKAKLILMIEGTDRKVMDGYERSKVKGSSILKTIDTFWYKYDLMPMFCADRRVMAWRMVNLWKTFERLYQLGESGRDRSGDHANMHR